MIFLLVMNTDVWKSFPNLIQERINGLLDQAEPTPLKAFHLFKTCVRENLWDESFLEFQIKLRNFFDIPRQERRKSSLDTFLLRPAHSTVYADFFLGFRSAQVEPSKLKNLAGWASQVILRSKKMTSPIGSEEIILQTLQKITNPALHEKDTNIEFEDFCEIWKQVSFKAFGLKYNQELFEVIKELRWLKTLQDQEALIEPTEGYFPAIYLTQTEIDWIKGVELALTFNRDVPPYPLSKGPQKPKLQDMVRTLQLYRIVQKTHLPELQKHRANIVHTLFDQCKALLYKAA